MLYYLLYYYANTVILTTCIYSTILAFAPKISPLLHHPSCFLFNSNYGLSKKKCPKMSLYNNQDNNTVIQYKHTLKPNKVFTKTTKDTSEKHNSSQTHSFYLRNIKDTNIRLQMRRIISLYCRGLRPWGSELHVNPNLVYRQSYKAKTKLSLVFYLPSS